MLVKFRCRQLDNELPLIKMIWYPILEALCLKDWWDSTRDYIAGDNSWAILYVRACQRPLSSLMINELYLISTALLILWAMIVRTSAVEWVYRSSYCLSLMRYFLFINKLLVDYGLLNREWSWWVNIKWVMRAHTRSCKFGLMLTSIEYKILYYTTDRWDQ